MGLPGPKGLSEKKKALLTTSMLPDPLAILEALAWVPNPYSMDRLHSAFQISSLARHLWSLLMGCLGNPNKAEK